MSGPRSKGCGRQQGAALVIGLILLLVLTILAISGVSSASLEFFMAGNEQYRQNAFQAAEAGIERAMSNSGLFNPAFIQTTTGTNNADAFSAQVTPRGQPTITFESSTKSFSTYYFEILSSATSRRGAQSTNVQGTRDTVNSSYVFGPCAGCTPLP